MRAYLLSTVAVVAACLAAAPGSAANISIGESLAKACYRSSMAKSLPRLAVVDCDRAIEEEALANDDLAATFVNRGILKMRAGDLRGADSDFDMALSMRGGEAEAYLNKGFLRLRQGQYQNALPFLDRSLEARTIRPA